MSNALGAQLNQDFRNAICGAPYQFGLLKQNLWHFLQRLHRGDQYTDGSTSAASTLPTVAVISYSMIYWLT
ncbi:IcmF-related protein [Vibrio sp. JCM 19052]|nr:IcmF-related protein [Vibrio sp. JCM 19052]